jgi:fatty-acyl-CoA synthase
MYIGDYLGRRAIYSPDKLAIVDAGKEPPWRLTYAQLNGRANRLANWLREVPGIKKGDRVAILARDGVEHLDTFFACGKLGAIHTALNWRLHWRETANILESITPLVLIYSNDFKNDVAEIQKNSEGRQPGITNHLHIEGEGIEWSDPFESTLQTSSSYDRLEHPQYCHP